VYLSSFSARHTHQMPRRPTPARIDDRRKS
jgi:hypothetical protein